eukprot:CAMPEP_0181494534 /NCGR_PEP_ID=MMETSP1110-20121109/51819_1 /TAXON_ID=174948 /ORGANISM="Symbiodinium sp., Strain CCMP421" /LENGTH=97 /DNA_ID=CAMNT_0023621945 /DNA_START=223 /DNA_END=514 /DNA_ORIENTATION=-
MQKKSGSAASRCSSNFSAFSSVVPSGRSPSTSQSPFAAGSLATSQLARIHTGSSILDLRFSDTFEGRLLSSLRAPGEFFAALLQASGALRLARPTKF